MRDPDIPHSRIPHTSSTSKEKHHLMSRTAKIYVNAATKVGWLYVHSKGSNNFAHRLIHLGARR